MTDVRNPRRLPALATVATALGVSLLIGGYAAFVRDDTVDPPSRAEAEAVLDEAVRLARAGDYTGLCQSVAFATGICRNLILGSQEAGWYPSQDRPEVLGLRQTADGSTVLRLRGKRADGSAFTSDFDVLRDDRGVRGGTVVYWSGVTIAE